jgi:hypothetical protein
LNKVFLFVFYLLILAASSLAQTPPDSSIAADTTIVIDSTILKPALPVIEKKDSVSKRPKEESNWPASLVTTPDFYWQVLKRHPYFGFGTTVIKNEQGDIRKITGKESLFYFILFLLFIFAILRQIFPKYFSDLFRLFFRTTLKQRQIRDQLMQTPLPSLLLNGFYILSAGLYVSLLFKYFKIDPLQNFWLLFLYCCIGLSAAYFVKFVFLKIAGWLFNLEEAANAYIFIVFIINKMIGIMLLPFIAILAFSVGNVYTAGLVLSWCLVTGLILYRFILTYASVRNQVKVNPFHFFLYLCAFEIAPLLLIYKLLLIVFQ